MTEAARYFQVPHSTVFGWSRRSGNFGSVTSEERRQVLEFAETHTNKETGNKFNVPVSTLCRWKREQKWRENNNEEVSSGTGKSQTSPESRSIINLESMSLERQKSIVNFTKTHGVVKAGKKFHIAEDELLSFMRKIGANKNLDDSWETREEILKYAQKHKNYNIASKKFGVEVSVIRKWVHSNKTIENTEGGADKTNIKEDDDEDPDSQEDEDDDPDFGSVPGKKKNPRIKRVKEFPDDIKEAAVKYGLEHGWTAAAAKYGTSSTSVSRWATYDDPKSPWKFKVSPK